MHFKLLKQYYAYSLAGIALLFFSGCATLPKDFEKPISYAYQKTDSTQLGKAINELTKGKSPASGILPLVSGIDAFTARYMLSRAAERSIDVQYYIWHNDTTGKLLVYALLEAADRGVRVRMLLDDINMAGKDEILSALHSHKNIEVRVFNPFANRNFRAIDFITDFSRINRRMHNKSFTVDNQATIVGGRNIGDEYFEANPNVDFHDFDVLAIGEVVKQVSDQFDLYWNSEFAYPVDAFQKHVDANIIQSLKSNLDNFIVEAKNTPYVRAIKKSEFINNITRKKLRFYWNVASVYYDEPDKIKMDHDDTTAHLLSNFQPVLDGVEKEFIAISPYFIPGDAGMDWFKEVNARGVSVKVLTNSLASTDVPIVYSGYAPYRIPLLQNNVKLYEIKTGYRPAHKKKSIGSSSRSSLHSKIYVFDRKNLFVGSYNLDPRSEKINTEMGILIADTELATQIGKWWDTTIEKMAYKLDLETIEGEFGNESRLVWYDFSKKPKNRYDEAPKASFWQKFNSDILSILPIENQL